MEDEMVLVFLNGTAMSGQENHYVVEGSQYLGAARTAPLYRFYSVRDEFPGLVRVGASGVNILGELYWMPLTCWRDALLPTEPEELEPGTVQLEGFPEGIPIGNRVVKAMTLNLDRLKPGHKLVDISSFGGWRAYRATLRAAGGQGGPDG
ncbi:MAG TPA: gamma-glutamylcyclotransferase [Acidimicrobiales bacterium]|nr:gamma-glutamylcyclotransferase [Acidimicrobiales bacterium]